MDDLVECQCCGRRFAPDRIEKHESVRCYDVLCYVQVCANQRKRKKFDSKKVRLEVEIVSRMHILSGYRSCTVCRQEIARTCMSIIFNTFQLQPKKEVPKKDWRRAHEEWMEILQQSRAVSDAERKG